MSYSEYNKHTIQILSNKKNQLIFYCLNFWCIYLVIYSFIGLDLVMVHLAENTQLSVRLLVPTTSRHRSLPCHRKLEYSLEQNRIQLYSVSTIWYPFNLYVFVVHCSRCLFALQLRGTTVAILSIPFWMRLLNDGVSRVILLSPPSKCPFLMGSTIWEVLFWCLFQNDGYPTRDRTRFSCILSALCKPREKGSSLLFVCVYLPANYQ